MAPLVTRRLRLGVTTRAIEQETGLNRHAIDSLIADRSQLEVLPLRIASRLATMLGLKSADQLTAPPVPRSEASHETVAPLAAAQRVAAALHAWVGWIDPAQIAHVLELTPGQTANAIHQLSAALEGTGLKIITSTQLGIRLAHDVDLIDDRHLDTIAQLRIRTREPSLEIARIIRQALAGNPAILHSTDDTTIDILTRLGYLNRRQTRYHTHPDIEYSITDAATQVRAYLHKKQGRGAAPIARNPPDADPNPQ